MNDDLRLPMFARFGQLVARHWWAVLASWIAVVVLTRFYAPRWDDVTYDGDLAYLPSSATSVRAEQLLEQAFPRRRAKSEMVLLATREDHPLTSEDLQAIDRVAARMHNLWGVASYREVGKRTGDAERLKAEGRDAEAAEAFAEADEAAQRAAAAWDEAQRLDPRCGEAYNNKAYFYLQRGMADEAAAEARLATDYLPRLPLPGAELLPANSAELPIIDVWTRYTDVVGSKLRSRDRAAELVVVRLSQEFMATDNIRVLQDVEAELDRVRSHADFPEGLVLGITGSAAVGGDMLRSAAESIQNTELYTVVLVVLILTVVYRSPLLVAIPLVTILVSVAVATACVAALTQLHRVPGWEWWNFKIFTTTRIFVVVILFGAGTDFCLFLISRYKEELERGRSGASAVSWALHGVGDALTASALTTIIGLATMFFAQFGKFRNSGPAIGLCLAVTLAACLSLAPALLSALGPAVFWPFGFVRGGDSAAKPGFSQKDRFWERLARLIVNWPGRILAASILLMTPLAVLGTHVQVTYDFLSELGATRPSKRGAEQMRRHFPVGETGPVVVLVHVPGRDLDSGPGKQALGELTSALYVDGVSSVRSLSEPRGEPPTGFSLKKAALQSHELTRSLYLSKVSQLNGDVARLEVVLKYDPFSIAAIGVLNEISRLAETLGTDSGSYWHGAEFSFAGTTSAIRDLREVTRGDNRRIQVLVVLAVLAVLLVILRRPIVCFYLILSVLFSYYVTMGATQLAFQMIYGETYHGLDWKVPLFLFVILVAIGQDYNIYLVTRVFEEQASHGLFGGLRRAIVRTGGIITSCGVIMAGTFVSMTTGSLRGIVELGFALSLGVMLDTFVVRPVLVPAFLALLFRFRAATVIRRDHVNPPHHLRRSSMYVRR